jgi:hypothetical protein
MRRATRRLKRYANRLLGVQPPPQPRDKHLWSIGIYRGTSPLDLAPDPRLPNPVFAREQVTDVASAFVADPFLMHADGTWHLFFELFDRRKWRGEIGVATSRDLATWRYDGIVLSEPFHLSYPFVFEWAGERYMIPETHQTRTIRLYRAEAFPRRWALVHTLMSGERYADTTLFRHADRWWLFTETSPERRNDTLRLFHADDLFGAWTEHPMSPIVQGDARAARPGGSVIASDQGIFRFAQDCAGAYGTAVHAFRITTLTPTAYAESPVDGNPLLRASGAGWNEMGMHHLDAHCVAPGEWVAAVDGWIGATADQIARRAPGRA